MSHDLVRQYNDRRSEGDEQGYLERYRRYMAWRRGQYLAQTHDELCDLVAFGEELGDNVSGRPADVSSRTYDDALWTAVSHARLAARFDAVSAVVEEALVALEERLGWAVFDAAFERMTPRVAANALAKEMLDTTTTGIAPTRDVR